jgi:hypothetical protein
MTEQTQTAVPDPGPKIDERCSVCGGFRTMRGLVGYDKAVCRGWDACLVQLLEETQVSIPRRSQGK